MKKPAAPAKVGKVRPAYKVGDVVKVKSGGPPMTVAEVHSPTTVTCQWYNAAECRFSCDTFSVAMLKRADASVSETQKSGQRVRGFSLAHASFRGDQVVVRLGCDRRGVTTWGDPVHVETLILKLGEHPTGGPALAEVFEAMKAEG